MSNSTPRPGGTSASVNYCTTLPRPTATNVDRYRQAEQLLSCVTFVDDRARLFHGWASLFIARSEGDTHTVTRALAEIDEAMRRWAFAARELRERGAWERQVSRLRDAGFGEQASSLASFAEQHARWGRERPRP